MKRFCWNSFILYRITPLFNNGFNFKYLKKSWRNSIIWDDSRPDVGGQRCPDSVPCLSVKIWNFQSGGFSRVRISNLYLILTGRNRTVISDRIRTALSADFCSQRGTNPQVWCFDYFWVKWEIPYKIMAFNKLKKGIFFIANEEFQKLKIMFNAWLESRSQGSILKMIAF